MACQVNLSTLVIIGHFVDVNKKFQAIFIEFLNVIYFLLPFSRQAKILNINYAKHQKRMSTSRGLNARTKHSINKLSIIPLVTWLFLADKVSLTYRQVSMNK